MLFGANSVLQGKPLYRDLSLYPHVYFAYPPAYCWVGATLVRLFGNHLFALRVFTLASELACLSLVYALSRRYRVSPGLSLFVTSWLAGLWSVHKFHTLARVDFFMLAWLLLAALALENMRDATLPKPFGLTLVAIPMAVLVKASAFPELLWMLAYLALQTRRRHSPTRGAVLALLAGLALAVVAIVALDSQSHGYLVNDLFTFQAYSGVARNWLTWGPFAMTFKLYLPLLAPMLLSMAFGGRGSLPTWMVAGSLLMLFFGSMKNGADVNYNLSFLVWLTLATGQALCYCSLTRPDRLKGLLVGFVAGALLYPVYRIELIRGPFIPRWDMAVAHDLRPERRAFRERVTRFVGQAPGPVLCEEPYFSVVNGKEVALSDPFQIYLLWYEGLFSTTVVVRKLHDGEIAYVVAGPRLMSIKPIADTLRSDFVVLASGIAMDQTTALGLFVHKSLLRGRGAQPATVPPGKAAQTPANSRSGL